MELRDEKNGIETGAICQNCFNCIVNKEITDSKLMDVIEAALVLLRAVRKLSSCLETVLMTHLSPLVTCHSMSLQPYTRWSR